MNLYHFSLRMAILCLFLEADAVFVKYVFALT